MKNSTLLFILSFFVSFSNAQTSVQDGNWTDPATWDCNCVPAPYLPGAINVTVNHNVVADIYDVINSLSGRTYFDGGSLTIGANGKLIQTGEGDLYMYNATLLVSGTLDMRRVAVNKGTATYDGIVQNCDSLWSDSSTVVNNGIITTLDHSIGQMGVMTNNGTINITNNMNIQGEYINSSTGIIKNYVDFSNFNVFGNRAKYTNDGEHYIGNNFFNGTNDTIQGNGLICISNLSTNQGTVLGGMTISTPTSSFSLNTGLVANTVSFNNNSCVASITEIEEDKYTVFPNPFQNILTIDGLEANTNIYVFSLDGKQIYQGKTSASNTIELKDLKKGIYFLKIGNSQHLYRIVKQ